VLVSADWVLPVSREPVRDGAVVTSGDTIVAVGSRRELESRYPAEERSHFSGSVITPGLVNAHTHLTLTALAGVVPSLPFAEWLPRLVAALKPWDIADHEASGVIGAELCLAAGVTVVGDIAYGAAEVASASRAGLGGVFYWEVLGIEASGLPATLAALRYPEQQDSCGPRVVPGLSPHSPYTSGPGLLRAVHDSATLLGAPVAIHVAESAAESELMHFGTGPLEGTAKRVAHGFEAPGIGSVGYLAGLGVLDGMTAVHLCLLEDGDVAQLASAVRGAVVCPRSNLFLHNPPPLIEPLLVAGIAVGVGTDSAASNADLDLFGELRAVRRAEPTLSARTLIEIATTRGARAIGVADRFGALEPGLQADMAVFAVDAGQEPEVALVERGGAACVSAVASGGVWRVREGSLVTRDSRASARASRAREASLEVIAQI
jgi:cytosine/adenosine deaminase-related metal-dependent hydrolase